MEVPWNLWQLRGSSSRDLDTFAALSFHSSALFTAVTYYAERVKLPRYLLSGEAARTRLCHLTDNKLRHLAVCSDLFLTCTL